MFPVVSLLLSLTCYVQSGEQQHIWLLTAKRVKLGRHLIGGLEEKENKKKKQSWQMPASHVLMTCQRNKRYASLVVLVPLCANWSDDITG